MSRILFVQTGNFSTAVNRINTGQEETYHDQEKSVQFVRNMAPSHRVTVASIGLQRLDKDVAPGLRVIEVPRSDFLSRSFGASLIRECSPDMVIARLPHFGVLNASVASQTPVFPCLADVFTSDKELRLLTANRLRKLIRNHRMRRIFSSKWATAIGNHSRSASETIEQVLGIDAEKITPWEWSRVPIQETPRDHPIGRPLQLLYAGKLSISKGVGDLLDAIRHVEAEAPGAVRLVLAGDGKYAAHFRETASQPGMPECKFLGRVPKSDVRSLMMSSDAAIVPSRSSYAEGLPNTVVEGLAFRLPLIVSDHASTRERLVDGVTALISRENDTIHMAQQVLRLVSERSLYESLSINASQAYESLFFGSPWYSLVSAFISDPTNETGWVRQSSLKELRK